MANIFPEPPIIEIGKSGFDGNDSKGRPFDILGRKPMGQKLTELVDRIDQPLVIALDGEWGSGKSHFLKLWTGAHQNGELGGKAKVIYFDAFEHDYLDDPLVSLISRLIADQGERTWSALALKLLKKAAYPLARLIGRVGVGVVTSGASEVVGAVGDVVIAKVGEATDSAIDQFWKAETGRIAAMQQFRDALQALTEPSEAGASPQKIVFIVDELDRCRPDYALSVLEVIKHFFTVPNVHFVLGTNLTALEHSVKARYGSEIDARKYIQKFIPMSLRFPPVINMHGNQSAAFNYLHATAGLYSIGQNTLSRLKEMFDYFSRGQEVHLRDVEKILTYVSLFPKTIDGYYPHFQTILIGATILRVLHPNEFQRLRDKRLRITDIARTLAVVKPLPDWENSQARQDWLTWAEVLETRTDILAMGVPAACLQDASSRISQIPWAELEKLFAEAFDSFSLPPS